MAPTFYSPPVSTYTALATTTLEASDASITFTSIPSSYRDLVLVVTGSLTGNSSLLWRANGDAGDNYNYIEMRGDGSTKTSSTAASSQNRGRFTNANVQNSQQFVLYAHFLDYSATDKRKMVLSRTNEASDLVSATVSRWENAATAISSIELFISVYKYQVGTTLSLYGIEA